MKTFTIAACSVLALPLVNAMPTVYSRNDATNSSVNELPSDIHGSSTKSILATLITLSDDQKAYLGRYQTFSDAASSAIGPKNNDDFSSSGMCTGEYPCQSVVHASVANIGTSAAINTTQMAAVLDDMTRQPSINLDQSNKDTLINGYKAISHGVVTEVFAPKGTVDSKVLAGMFNDMFKLQAGDGNGVNSIRAVQAATDGKPAPVMALCLYPEGSDAATALNFCTGKQLDGSRMPVTAASRRFTKRFSLDGLLTGFCHLIDLPILCPEDD